MKKKLLAAIVVLALVLITVSGIVGAAPSPRWDARIAGGGQILAESGVLHRNGRDINYKISFGLGAYIVDGELWLDSCEVTFHNVSHAAIVKGKFVGTSAVLMVFASSHIATLGIDGEFNGLPGYRVTMTVKDSSDPCPHNQDHIRLRLWEWDEHLTSWKLLYDSLEDFPAAYEIAPYRATLDRGRLTVEDLR